VFRNADSLKNTIFGMKNHLKIPKYMTTQANDRAMTLENTDSNAQPKFLSIWLRNKATIPIGG
jgi:hypothetical protein